jgi:hypothetical protein
MNITDIETQARFWNKVKVIPESNSDACWIWQGGTMPNRSGHTYGVASIGKSKTMLAHRFAASLGQDITNKVVQHKCDNPLCVRPSHLRVGTQKDNMQDMYSKDRQNSKLDVAAVLDIRTCSFSRTEYAKKYGVSEYTIGAVQRKDSWAWV